MKQFVGLILNDDDPYDDLMLQLVKAYEAHRATQQQLNRQTCVTSVSGAQSQSAIS